MKLFKLTTCKWNTCCSNQIPFYPLLLLVSQSTHPRIKHLHPLRHATTSFFYPSTSFMHVPKVFLVNECHSHVWETTWNGNMLIKPCIRNDLDGDQKWHREIWTFVGFFKSFSEYVSEFLREWKDGGKFSGIIIVFLDEEGKVVSLSR